MEPYEYDQAVVAAVEAELAGIFAEASRLKDDPYVVAGSTAGSAALAVTLGFVGLAGTTAALPVIISALGIASGFAGLGLATAQLFAAVTGSKVVVDANTDEMLGLAGSPFQLGAAAVGSMIDGDSGFRRGIEIGKAADAVYSIKSGLHDYLKEKNDKGMIDIAQGLLGLSQLDPDKILNSPRPEQKQPEKQPPDKEERKSREEAERREAESKERAQKEAQAREEERQRTEQAIARAAEEMRAREQAERDRRDRADRERERRLGEERKLLEELERKKAQELQKRKEEEERARKEAERAAAERRRKEEEEAAKQRAAQAEADRHAAQVAADSAQAQREDRQRSGAGYTSGGGGYPGYSNSPNSSGNTTNNNPVLRLP